jgi:hypothetical protein
MASSNHHPLAGVIGRPRDSSEQGFPADRVAHELRLLKNPREKKAFSMTNLETWAFRPTYRPLGIVAVCKYLPHRNRGS